MNPMAAKMTLTPSDRAQAAGTSALTNAWRRLAQHRPCAGILHLQQDARRLDCTGADHEPTGADTQLVAVPRDRDKLADMRTVTLVCIQRPRLCDSVEKHPETAGSNHARVQQAHQILTSERQIESGLNPESVAGQDARRLTQGALGIRFEVVPVGVTQGLQHGRRLVLDNAYDPGPRLDPRIHVPQVHIGVRNQRPTPARGRAPHTKETPSSCTWIQITGEDGIESNRARVHTPHWTGLDQHNGTTPPHQLRGQVDSRRTGTHHADIGLDSRVLRSRCSEVRPIRPTHTTAFAN